MEKKEILFKVDLNEKNYRAFCVFDSIKRTKSWVRPTIFAAILLAFAIACFCLTSLTEQAILLGVVLAVVGIGLPAVYFGSFFQSVNARVKRFKLDGGKSRHAYDVTLTDAPDGITVAAGVAAPLKFGWKELYMAYRCKDVIYLYVAQGKAYILPDDATEGTQEEAWALITSCAPQGKTAVFTK